MKKLISILLVMAMVSSSAMSIGCFADEENLLVGDQSELLLNQENDENGIKDLTENNCGLACKTKNFAGSAWKTLKEIPGTIKVLASSVITGTVFFTKFYKTYKNEISRLNDELSKANVKLPKVNDEQPDGEDKSILDKINDFLRQLKFVKPGGDPVDLYQFFNFFNNTTQRANQFAEECQILQDLVQSQTDQMNGLTTENEELENAMKEKENEAEEQKKQIEELQKRMEELQNQRLAEAEKHKKHKKQIKALKKEKEDEAEEQKKQIEMLQKQMEELQNQRLAEAEEHEELKKIWKAKLRLEKRLKKRKNELNELSKNLMTIEENNKKHSEEINLLKTNVTNAIQLIEDPEQKAENEELRKQMEELQNQRLAEAEEMERTVNILESKLTACEKFTDNSFIENKKLEEENKKLQEENNNYKARLDQIFLLMHKQLMNIELNSTKIEQDKV